MNRLIIGFATAAITAAAVAAVAYEKIKQDKEKDENEDDDEIHFVKITDDEEEVKEEDSAVKEVLAIYPYLDAEFVSGVLAKDAEFNEKYPEDTLVNVIHKVTFADVEKAASFTDIMEPAGYKVEANGQEIEASRRFFTEPGAIISDVLNVANQTKALEGTYTDYTVSE
ncbi:MAG: hypothetical protein IKD69_16255 [Solobacterium sp.]|nr:hypothetical protein [Solobacterium sp.]